MRKEKNSWLLRFKQYLFPENKKGMSEGIIVTVIMMAVVMIIALRFYSSAFALMRGIGEDYFFCLSKKVISAYTKIPIAGITVWGASCTPIFHTLSLVGDSDDPSIVDLNEPFARKDYENIATWYELSKADLKGQNDFMKRDKFDGSGGITDYLKNKDHLLGKNKRVPFLVEYRFEEAIAKAMKRCWGRNGQGDLPIGKQWHDAGIFKDLTGDSTVIYCDLCEVIQFKDDVATLFAGGSTMDSFLKNNPTSRVSRESFWEYIRDGSLESDFFTSYPYTIKTKPAADKLENNDLAVVYKRFNQQQLGIFSKALAARFSDSPPEEIFDVVQLMPLDDYQVSCKIKEVTAKK
tara:strand:+ start:1207 stop:2253 length:1047 start_codon:yes stop_codon:yes gene_type:complete